MSRTPTQASNARRYLPIIVVVVVVAVAALIAVLASAGGDSDTATGDGSGTSEPLIYSNVEVDGAALPQFDGNDPDPAAGQPAPTLRGSEPDGTAVKVDFGQPTLLAFLAHWCPHCQAELPRLVQLADQDGFGDVRPVVVLTGTDPAAPNFPPADWIEREGWSGDVLVDTERQAAAAAYGLSSYPYLVLVGADGNVIARTAGEKSPEELQAFVAQAG